MKKTLSITAIALTAALVQTATPALAKQHCQTVSQQVCRPAASHGGQVQCKTVTTRRCIQVQENSQIGRGRVRGRGFGVKRRG